jgi:SecD/SecF fusion protein
MAYLTAVLITRVILELFLDKEKSIGFQTKSTANWFIGFNFDFVGKRKFAYVISAAVILLGIYSMQSKGFELGVDFNGGRSYIVKFEDDVTTDIISNSLRDQFEGKAPLVKTFGEQNQVKITTSYLVDDNSLQADQTIKSKLFEGLKSSFASDISSEEFFNDDENKKRGLLQSTMVGPTIADDFQRSATYATIFGLAIIFLYILFRFRWQYGTGAVFAVVHDVFIVLSLFSIFKNILPFSLEIDQAFIAALLTIIGYSINDTVVIFDRIREYLLDNKTKDFKEVINAAVNKTLSRTIMTSVTTLLVVVILFILGGEVIRGFAFALLIGVISGTYSSIFIATPAVVDLPGKKR